MFNPYLRVIVSIALIHTHLCEKYCSQEDGSCTTSVISERYSKESNLLSSKITSALDQYAPCKKANCSCHKSVLNSDLAPFKDGITTEMFTLARSKGTKYQIIQGKLYREKDCHFPSRCTGIEHYLTALAPKMPDMELAINTRDWPQLNRVWGHAKAPVLSFSINVQVAGATLLKGRASYYKGSLYRSSDDDDMLLTSEAVAALPNLQGALKALGPAKINVRKGAKTPDYYDIMYPAWSFWEGGPAISLYPTGIGRWDKHRVSISAAAEKWPWEKKETKAFFRGSRTNAERDPLVYLSRSDPDLVDAQYTKNQAWKSDADTLYAPPASEVSFEDHCQYKYLFNYRGVAASFRFKHLFLCKSLVFHVGDTWLEFYYPSLKPWVHYVPISPTATKEDIKKYIEYFKEHDSIAREIAERGFEHIWENLTDKDVKCYWRKLLKDYAKLVKYEVVKDEALILIN